MCCFRPPNRLNFSNCEAPQPKSNDSIRTSANAVYLPARPRPTSHIHTSQEVAAFPYYVLRRPGLSSTSLF
uniref:Ovule protein n=1 Tax=Steinernema glaseri TaxID=37863 RepID=A0A1I8A3E2_9BILA